MTGESAKIARDTASIALVGCSGSKLDHPAPARQLYTSQLFRSTIALAERSHDVVYIISAKHELVLLDQVIEPYNRVKTDLAKEWRVIWGLRVWSTVLARHQKVDRQIFIYAGKDYAQPIIRAGFHQGSFQEPLAKMQIGQRLQWLRGQLDALAVAR